MMWKVVVAPPARKAGGMRAARKWLLAWCIVAGLMFVGPAVETFGQGGMGPSPMMRHHSFIVGIRR